MTNATIFLPKKKIINFGGGRVQMNDNRIKYIFEKYYNGEKNFVTPRVYGYTLYRYDSENLVLFEKSTNTERTIYGASALHYNPVTSNCQKIELSKCFSTSQEVNKYINKLTPNDFEEALIYGEVKKII